MNGLTDAGKNTVKTSFEKTKSGRLLNQLLASPIFAMGVAPVEEAYSQKRTQNLIFATPLVSAQEIHRILY